MTLAQNQPLAVRPLTAEVRSEANPDQAYVVTLPYCPCKDFYNRRGNAFSLLCKHLKKAMGIPDTSRLDETSAEELLTDLGVGETNVTRTLKRAVMNGVTTATAQRGSVVVILHNPGSDTFDVRLP